MKTLILLFPFLILASCSTDDLVIPEVDQYADCTPKVVAPDISKIDAVTGLIEFDILPDMPAMKGVALTSPERLWIDGVIPYYFESHRTVIMPDGRPGTILGYEGEDRIFVRETLAEFSKEVEGVLTFLEYPDQKILLENHSNGIVIGRGFASSSSHLGRQNRIQPLSLTFDAPKSTVKHEFMHAAGIHHEFTRSDRDEHLTIHFKNIPERYHKQFERDTLSSDCGPFDIESIMMYGSFQIHQDAPQMTTADGETFEQSQTLSDGDIKTIKALYLKKK